jgi:ABC-type uncharacterized transport system permease subunit
MKKVNMTLIDVDSNIYSVFVAFNKMAKMQGWTQQEIKLVIDQAKAAHDYKGALGVICDHIEDGEDGEDGE